MNDTADNITGYIEISKPKSFIGRFWMFLLAAIVFLIGQWPLLSIWWNDYWDNIDGYYSHGFLVPILAGIMVYINKPRLDRVELKGSWLGLALLLICIPLYTLGMLAKVQLLCGIAFLLSIFGITIATLGLEVTKIVTVPILFLSTMIPFANYVLDTLTLRYQIISTTLAAKILALFDGSVQQAGNTITSSNLPEPLIVGVPCSGLKLLVTLIMCCWFITYVTDGSRCKKLIVVAMALPLSIICNTIRIVMIGLVGLQTCSSDAMKSFHDWSGYITLALCAAIVYGFIYLLRMHRPRAFTFNERLHVVQITSPIPNRYLLIGCLAVLVLTVNAIEGWRANALLKLPSGHLDKASIPKSFGNWVGQDLEIDTRTKELLSKGDHLSRIYINPAGDVEPVTVFITAGMDSTSFHNPLICLASGGAEIRDKQMITLMLGNYKPIAVKATTLIVDRGNTSTLIIYWYMCGRHSWSDTDNVQIFIKQENLMEGLLLLRNPFLFQGKMVNAGRKQILWYRFSTEITDERSAMKHMKQFVRDFIHNTNNIDM